MAESGLALNYESLLRAVGHHLGFGIASGSYSEGQMYQADEVSIQGGLRKFYSPEPMGKMPPVSWSFLRPLVSLSLVSAVSDYDLSDEFAYLLGKVTILTTTGNYAQLETVNEGMIRAYRSSSSSASGVPRFVAIRPKPVNQGFGQRWEMLIYPEPQTTYTLQFRQQVMPGRLTPQNCYPYGGVQHAQTILAACLSEAEVKVQDIMNGPQQLEYMKRLAASISLDGQTRGEHLGYCGDPSTPECYHSRRGGIRTDETLATYNGTSY